MSLKELCLHQISETVKTEILLNRSSHFMLYRELVAMEFFNSWYKTSNFIDKSLIVGLNDDALDIIYKWRANSPNLYWLVIEREFWDTFFLF